MDRVVRMLERHVQRAQGAERFVKLIVGGGLALVAGLWIVTLTVAFSFPWLLGLVLVLLGLGALGSGIWSEVEY